MQYTSPYVTHIAQADYSCGAYGQSGFGTCPASTPTPVTPVPTTPVPSTTTPSPQPTPTQSGGFLADTGYDVILPVALAASVLIAATLYLLRRLLRSRPKP